MIPSSKREGTALFWSDTYLINMWPLLDTLQCRKEVRGGQCLTPMSALRHFHTKDWGTGQILGRVFSSLFFFSVSNCLSGLFCLCCWNSLWKNLGKHTCLALASPWSISHTFHLGAWSYYWGGGCNGWWDPITEIKARKAEAFISVTLASPALYKGSFFEDQEVSLRNWFSLRKKELGGGGGWETWDGGRKVVVWQLLSKPENPWSSQKAERNSLEKVVLGTMSTSITMCGPCSSRRSY